MSSNSAAVQTAGGSGWPWMKGTDFAMVESPIPLVHDQDDRPAVRDLITEYRTLIDEVATELRTTESLYDPTKHDDLWILRFLISHKKKVKAAMKAAKYTLAFRAEHNLDDMDIRYFPIGPNVPSEPYKRYLKYCKDETFRLVIPDARLGVVGFLVIAGVDQDGLVANVDEADWLPSMVYVAEWSHQWADYLTRTTGRLTSSIRVCDISGLALTKMNRECSRRDAKAMKVTEDCYPQMLKTLFVCNAPSFLQIFWRMMRPLFPKRVVEKTDFISPLTNTKERNRLLQYISIDALPTRYGGNNEAWPVNIPLP